MKLTRAVGALLLSSGLFAAGCGSSDDDGSSAPSDAGTSDGAGTGGASGSGGNAGAAAGGNGGAGDAGPPVWPERMQLGATPVQADVTDNLFYGFRDMPLGDDVDVVSLHFDFYGIPWDQFADDASLPAAWVSRIDEVAQLVDAWQRPVFLSLTPLDGQRDRPAATARDSGGNLITEGSDQQCFNFATHADGERYRRAFVRYSRWMADRFDPAAVVLGIEVNVFDVRCRNVDSGAWDALVSVLNEARRAIRSAHPGAPVAPSIQVDDVIDVRENGECFGSDGSECITKNLARIAALEADFFGASTYPHLIEPGGVTIDAKQYLARVFEQTGAEHFVIAETGYNSRPMKAQVIDPPAPCTEIAAYDDQRQRAHLAAMLSLAESWPVDYLVWWSDRDVYPRDAYDSCPCQAAQAGYCDVLSTFRSQLGPPAYVGELLFKAFGAMGLREYDGTPKPILADWQAARGQ